ncbi:MAG: hypothetical protein WCQ16_02800 [Verrucomicrobiae bacterium]
MSGFANADEYFASLEAATPAQDLTPAAPAAPDAPDPELPAVDEVARAEYFAGLEKASAQTNSEHFSKLYTDPEFFADKKKELSRGLPVGLMDDAAHQRAANMAFLSAESGQEVTAGNYDFHRDGYARARYGKDSPVTDGEFFGLTKIKFEGEKARSNAENKLLGSVFNQITAAYDPNVKAVLPNPVEMVQTYTDLNPDFVKGLNPQQAEEVKKRAIKLVAQMSDTVQEDAPAVGVIFRAMTNQTGQIKSDTAPAMGEAISTLALMTPEKRQAVYKAVTLMLHDKGLDPKSEFENLGDALGRGTIGTLNQMTRVAFEEAQRAELATYQDMLKKESASPAPITSTTGADGQPWSPLPAPLTRPQLEEKITQTKANLDAIKIIREVDAQAKIIDPVKSAKDGIAGIALNAVFGATESLGYMALSATPVIGGPLMFYSIAAQKQESLMLENPDMKPDDARNAAYAFALPSAILENFQMGLFRGKAPIFFETMKAMKMAEAGAVGRAGHILGDLAARTGEETGIEMAQGVLEAAFDALRQDRPGFDFKTELKNLAGTFPETLGTMFVMSLVGTGVASVREIHNGNALLKSTEVLRQAGLDHEQVAEVITQPTDIERQTRLVDIWDKRSPENIAKGKERQKAAIEKAEAIQKSAEMPTREATPQDDGTFLYTIKAADGRIITVTADKETADLAWEGERKAHVAGVSADVREAVDWIQKYQEAIGRGDDLKITLEGAPKSFLQLYNANPSQKNLDRFFETVRQIPAEITEPGQLANYFSVARNEGKIIEGIYKSVISISNGANARHTLREFAQDNLKRAMVEEGVTIEWVREQLDAMKTGDKAVKGYEGMVTDTDTAVIESFSDVAVNLFVGKTKDAEIPTGLRSFLRQVKVLGKEIIYQVFHLKRAMADGRVDKNFHEFLARSVGLDLDAQLKIEGAKAMRQMEQEALDALHSGDGAESLQGEHYSVVKAPLAPNGKPSNLTPELHSQVRTPAFKAGFGDWEGLARQNYHREIINRSLGEKKWQDKTVVANGRDADPSGKLSEVFGFRVSKQILTPDDIRKIFKRHGEGNEKNPDQIGLNRDDVVKMLEVLRDPETFKKTTSQNGKPSAEFGKKFTDGTLIVAEVEVSEKGAVSVKSAWKKKPGRNHAGGEAYPVRTSENTAGNDSTIHSGSLLVNPDSVSKAVDENGEPIPVYHGSPDIRGIVADGFKGFSRGEVFFGSDSFAVADTYADDKRALDYQNAEPHTLPLAVRLLNPMIVDAGGKHWRDTERYVSEAKEKGHDGIIIKNSLDEYSNKSGGKTSTVFAWFESNQAKSLISGQLNSRVDGKPIAGATANRGTFDPADPRINYSIVRKEDLDPDRVQNELDARMRNPAERLAVYERAKAMFVAERARRADAIDPNRKFESLRQSMMELNAILSALPPEIRGKVGGMMTLANMGKDTVAGNREATIDKFLVERIGMIDRELERALSAEYREAITKALKKARPKKGDNGVKKSTLGAETQAFADSVFRATLLDAEATGARMQGIEAAMEKTEDVAELAKLSEEWSILNSFGDLENRPAESLAASLSFLKEQLQSGRESWRIKEQARIEEHRARAREVSTHLGSATAKQRFANKGFILQMKDIANNYLLDHASFEQFALALLGDKVGKSMADRMRKSDTAQQVMELTERRAILDALRAGAKAAGMSTGKGLAHMKEDQKDAVEYWDGRKVKDERISIELAEKIVRGQADASNLSKADIQTLRDELAAIPAGSQKEFVTIRRVIAEGRPVKLDMSRAKAIQLLLSWGQRDVQEKMRREGWTDQSAADMQAMTGDLVSQSVLAHARELYGKGYDVTNPVYAGMFGMNMPQVGDYAPSRFIHAKDVKDVGLDGSPMSTGTLPSFAKSRVSHSAKIAPADALTVMQQHVLEQSHWVHFAELARDFRSLISSPEIREAIKQKHGEGVLQSAELWADQLEKRGGNRAREAAWLQSAMGAVLGGKAISALGFNLKTITMQIENAIRFGLSINPRQMMDALSDPAGIAADIKTVWESNALQVRLHGGATAESRFLFDKYGGKGLTASQIAEISMAPINWMDCAATSISAAIVHRSAYQDAIKAGMSEKMAADAALDAAAAAIYRFAQPVSFGQKSRFENNGNILAKTFFLFMSDPRLKTSIMLDSVRALATGRGTAAERVQHVQRLVTIELMALLSHVIACLYRDTFTDDDKEDIWTMGGFGRALALAPLQGFFLVGTVSDQVLASLFKQKFFTPTVDPFLDAGKKAIQAVKNFDHAFDASDPDATFREWSNILKSLSLHPSAAVPAVLINVLKPIIGAKKNLEKPPEK